MFSLDECLDSPCSTDKPICKNTEGSFECSCNVGFELIDDKCENIDECIPSTWRPGTKTCFQKCGGKLGLCPEHCEGGYCCKKDDENCPQAAREVLTHDYSQCAVPVNFQDPCLSKQHSTCHDTDGSFECECDSGFTYLWYINECLDIDECSLGEQGIQDHPCPDNSECTNISG